MLPLPARRLPLESVPVALLGLPSLQWYRSFFPSLPESGRSCTNHGRRRSLGAPLQTMLNSPFKSHIFGPKIWATYVFLGPTYVHLPAPVRYTDEGEDVVKYRTEVKSLSAAVLISRPNDSVIKCVKCFGYFK